MARIAVPKACMGVEMEDGTKYNRKREGFIEVTDDHHLKAVERSIPRQYHWIGVGGTFFDGKSGPVCDCHRTAWPWEETCPKCGKSLASSLTSTEC